MPDVAESKTPRLAYVVSSHGFGHAARAAAVIDALWRLRPEVEVVIFGRTPPWFFDDSLGRAVGYHAIDTDIGLVQSNALEEDLSATVDALGDWLPIPASRLDGFAEHLRPYDLVVCDISPLGLAAAEHAGVPSLLVENFTWDWIYRGYTDVEPRLVPFAEALQRLFSSATRHVQATPCCDTAVGAQAVEPIARRPRLDRSTVRQRLDIPDEDPMVLVTMGGIEWDYSDLEGRLEALEAHHWLVIPGSGPEPKRHGRCVRLPHRSEFYHPDLIHAADAVVGKLGYSTVAEVCSAGLPFAYVPRPHFPESPPVEAWVRDHLPSLCIPAHRFVDGGWLDDLPALLALPKSQAGSVAASGADQVATVITEMLGSASR